MDQKTRVMAAVGMGIRAIDALHAKDDVVRELCRAGVNVNLCLAVAEMVKVLEELEGAAVASSPSVVQRCKRGCRCADCKRVAAGMFADDMAPVHPELF